tara:strand:- start:3936 stop:4421 length:486 start_codon:yes stop_codon:yes gene_type:complete
MTFTDLKNYLNTKAANKFEANDDEAYIDIKKDNWIELSNILKNDKNLLFDYLMCITSYDLNDQNHYGVIYNFFSNKHKHYLEVKIEVSDDHSIPSVSHIWKTADWHEREAYDMMGIKFEGHPNLKRILLSDDWEGHPLRKDYKEPDYYHGMPVPKDKTYWE